MANRRLQAPVEDESDDWEIVSHETVTSTISSTARFFAWDFICAALVVSLMYIGVPVWLHGAAIFYFRPFNAFRWAWRKFCFSFLWRQTKRLQY